MSADTQVDTLTQSLARHTPEVVSVESVTQLDQYPNYFFETLGVNGIAAGIPAEVVSPEADHELFVRLNDGDKNARAFEIDTANILLVQLEEYEHMIRRTDKESGRVTWFYLDINQALQNLQASLERAEQSLSIGGSLIIQDVIGVDLIPNFEFYDKAIIAAGFVVVDSGQFDSSGELIIGEDDEHQDISEEKMNERLSGSLREMLIDEGIRDAFWIKLMRQSDYSGNDDDTSNFGGPNKPSGPLSPLGFIPLSDIDVQTDFEQFLWCVGEELPELEQV